MYKVRGFRTELLKYYHVNSEYVKDVYNISTFSPGSASAA